MKRTIIVHPFLFATYAVLGVYATNAVEFPVQWIIRPWIVLLLVVTITFLLLQAKVQNLHRAGLLTTLLLFWFFFGHFHRALFEISPFWNTTLGILLAFILWTAPLAFLGSGWTWRHISNPGLITSIFNLTSIFVLFYPVYISGNAYIQIARHSRNSLETKTSAASSLDLKPVAMQPDIYLIILDAYGREDYLREGFGFDNHEFIDYLVNKGFYVANQSTPNYPQTSLSLSSLLNMQYLDDFTKDLKHTNIRGPVYDLIRDSIVRSSLHDSGYTFVALPSTTFFTQMRDADVYYQMTLGNINEFEGLLLYATVANFVIQALDLDVPVPGYGLHRRYVFYSLDTLETVPSLKGPKFVFAHLMAPHPPFVVDENENMIQSNRPYDLGDATDFQGTSNEYINGYVSEVRFLNRRFMSIIDKIIAQSDHPPIIILMGDHGPANYFDLDNPNNPCLWERYSILNAYYFPDGNYQALYKTITPVNTFRVILNQYFGAHLALLEDRNYFARWSTPYAFQDVTDQSQTCHVGAIEKP
jgi:hypothetical protein